MRLKPVAIPRTVWALGLVSLFMDVSSELVHSLLPALFVTMGIGMGVVGLIEGAAEATASMTKLLSGSLSDRLGKRKALAVIGYGLATASKFLFPLAQSAEVLFSARFIDRIGKGIRGAPRDALIADVTPRSIRGAAYGLRQALDSAGAFAGPLLAIALMAYFSNDITPVLWVAVIPALVCMMLLVFGVQEPDVIQVAKKDRGASRPIFQRTELAELGGAFWFIVLIGALFALARFSAAFLALRAIDLGLPIGWSPLVLVLMSAVYSLSSYPAGRLADRIDRRVLLALGLLLLIVAQVVLASASGYAIAMIGVALWGAHMGFTKGVLSALVADEAPGHLRGTAFGLFSFVDGIALLIASAAAGILWQMLSPEITFFAGAIFAAASLLLLILRIFTGRV